MSEMCNRCLLKHCSYEPSSVECQSARMFSNKEAFHITELQKTIILNKCDERELKGYKSLTDSDIMDILEECEKQGEPLSRKEINVILEENA